MTTDPRVIEVAKALSDVQRTLVTGFCPDGNYAEISGRKYWFGADHEARDKFVAEHLSKTVILKWLEQPASDAAYREASDTPGMREVNGCIMDSANHGRGLSPANHAPNFPLKQAHAAMNVQAAKEISGE